MKDGVQENNNKGSPRFLELAFFQSGPLTGNVRSQVRLVLQRCGLADI